jgi:carbon storage regulator
VLILTRRVGETLYIELPTGETIRVAVLGSKGNQVRVGIEAPSVVALVREELVERAGERTLVRRRKAPQPKLGVRVKAKARAGLLLPRTPPAPPP